MGFNSKIDIEKTWKAEKERGSKLCKPRFYLWVIRRPENVRPEFVRNLLAHGNRHIISLLQFFVRRFAITPINRHLSLVTPVQPARQIVVQTSEVADVTT